MIAKFNLEKLIKPECFLDGLLYGLIVLFMFFAILMFF